MRIIVEAYKSGLFAKRHLLGNILAGIIVGVISLPLTMAFAIASGVAPVAGIYTAIVAGAVAAVFGGSLVQITGPTGAFIIILSGITSKYGMAGLQVATIIAGIILILMGILRFGIILKYIPYPVILGFTAGIAVVIFVGQWHNFLGVAAPVGSEFYDKLWQLMQSMPHTHMPTFLLGSFSLGLLIFAPRIKFLKRIPATIIVLVVVTLLHKIFNFSGVATIGSVFGGIPRGLPNFALPHWDLYRMQELFLPGFTIAALGAIESLLSALVADNMAGTRHDSNRELMGQGLANIVSPMFGGFAATGAIARTATSIKSGANSPLAGLVSCLVLVLVLLFLSPLVAYIPLTMLSAILFIVAFNMSEIGHFIKVLKTAPKFDVVSLLVTFILTIFLDLVTAVFVGIIVSALTFMIHSAKSLLVKEHANNAVVDKVQVYTIHGPMFFAATDIFARQIDLANMQADALILRFLHVSFIDISAINFLDEFIRSSHQYNIRLIFSEVPQDVKKLLCKAKLDKLLGQNNLCESFELALEEASQAIKE